MLSRLSIRWRLALISAALTFVVLLGFALAYGRLTETRITDDFESETAAAATKLSERISITPDGTGSFSVRPSLAIYGAANDAQIKLFWSNGRPVDDGTLRLVSPDLGRPTSTGSTRVRGYLVETRFVQLQPEDGLNPGLSVGVWVQYARPLNDLNETIRRLRLLLAIGVFGGTVLALAGGLVLARRSLRPITTITEAARDISRTGDTGQRVPQPPNDDEVAELARTFDEMLESIERSQRETESALERQREFVADASHELRTPLTSVLANLELLSGGLEGEERDTAEAALRSTRRMRRIVSDLLLLARNDAGREPVRAEVDLGRAAEEAAAEVEGLAEGRAISIEAGPGVVVTGDPDALHRLVRNLIENAVLHTPAGTEVSVSVTRAAGNARLVVEDNGPGIPREQREKIFDRFVRQGGDSGRSTGLGLAIVRAVAEENGGAVALEDAGPGCRFVVDLPLAGSPAPTGDAGAEPESEGVRPR